MMRTALAAIALAAMLPAGCITAPVAVADATALDEQAALAVELAYQASAVAMVAAARSGRLAPATRDRLRTLDRRAYLAVRMVRASYDAGNARSYREAAVAARQAVRDLLVEVAR